MISLTYFIFRLARLINNSMQPLIMTLAFFSIFSSSTDIGAIAFFQTECPQGWGPYLAANNKFILAQGNKYTIGETGGSDTVTLTVEQIPSHSHVSGQYNRLLRMKSDCGYTAPGSDRSCGQPDIITSQPMSSTGGSKPHSNMPPYIVLKACIKVNETIKQTKIQNQSIEVINPDSQNDRSFIISVIALAFSILEGIIILLKFIRDCQNKKQK